MKKILNVHWIYVVALVSGLTLFSCDNPFYYENTDEPTDVLSLEIIQYPAQRLYLLNEALNCADLIVNIYCRDEQYNEENLTIADKRVKLSGFDSKAAGFKTIKVSVSGKSRSFIVVVLNEEEMRWVGDLSDRIPKTTYYANEIISIELRKSSNCTIYLFNTDFTIYGERNSANTPFYKTPSSTVFVNTGRFLPSGNYIIAWKLTPNTSYEFYTLSIYP